MSETDCKKFVISMAEYILTHDISNVSAVQIYNNWSRQTGLAPVEAKEADWCLTCLAEIKDMDKNLLAEAYNLDIKNYPLNNFLKK